MKKYVARPFDCGIGPAFNVIGGKWKAAILFQLNKGALRSGQLKKCMTGITEKMLIQQLREMEGDGIIERKVFQEVPPRVEYSVTPSGKSLCNALCPIGDWGETFLKNKKK